MLAGVLHAAGDLRIEDVPEPTVTRRVDFEAEGRGALPAQLLRRRVRGEAQSLDLTQHPLERVGSDLVRAVESVAHRLARHARGLGDVDDRRPATTRLIGLHSTLLCGRAHPVQRVDRSKPASPVDLNVHTRGSMLLSARIGQGCLTIS